MKAVANVVFSVFILNIYTSAVRIGSFNLHQYGSKKAANSVVTNYVAEILNDFDIAVIQEISDVSLKAPYVLYDALNKLSKSKGYSMALSERVGRSSTKEQYIFFNRESTSGVTLINSYVYDDTENYFERPPFIGTFEVKKPSSSGVKHFTIVNVHLRPDAAYEELLNMRYVIRDFILTNPKYFAKSVSALSEILAQNVISPSATNKPRLETNHPILIMGDFNADCSYISLKRQTSLRSINFADFTWLINNQVKTNTRQTCTYDRILINGDRFLNSIIPNSNTTVNYQDRFDLTLDEAIGISDHFPIKFDIKW